MTTLRRMLMISSITNSDETKGPTEPKRIERRGRKKKYLIVKKEEREDVTNEEEGENDDEGKILLPTSLSTSSPSTVQEEEEEEDEEDEEGDTRTSGVSSISPSPIIVSTEGDNQQPQTCSISLQTGQRSRQEALTEFKHIRSNDKKHTKRIEEEEEPCQCKTSCDTDCLNRGLLIECNPKTCPVELKSPGCCGNQRMSRGNKKKTDVRTCSLKGVGLYALETIPAGSFVIEYVGEVIDERECARRLADDYFEEKHKYLMCMNGGLVIDATRKGNLARFINHSCEPNCTVQEWKIRGESRMGIFSIRNIQRGEEISFDYNFQRFGETAQKCYCGTESCHGWLGRSSEEEKNLKSQRKKIRLGYDPVLNDHVGIVPDEASLRKTLVAVQNFVESSIPKPDILRTRSEGLFLIRNAKRSLQQIYDKQNKIIGW